MSFNWVRYARAFFASTLLTLTLTLTVLGISAIPTFAAPLQEEIAERMMELQSSDNRWISVDLSNQRLIAWEGGSQVYAVIISTGKKSTPTRQGVFTIKSKHRTDRMRGEGYDIPNVPYTMYYEGGYAIHGAFWHHRFGTPVSHGCVNVAVNHARWLFDWASVGTPVIIHQ